MSFLKKVYEAGSRLRQTAPVDDEFPRLMHEFDTALRRVDNMPGLPTIVCLCGSTKFKDEFIELNKRLTFAGNIVLSVGCFGHADNENIHKHKEQLDRLHLRKIDLADIVYIIDPGGYIGESTQRELVYARETGKQVRFLSQMFKVDK